MRPDPQCDRRGGSWRARVLTLILTMAVVGTASGPSAATGTDEPPPPGPAAPGGAGTGPGAGRPRAVTTLRPLQELNHVLRGNFAGDGSVASFSSPAIADITGDGAPEIVTATVDGWVIAYRPDGTVLWRRDVGRTSIQTSPAIADMDGDGRADVVVGTLDGRIIMMSGPTGAVLRIFRDGGIQGCLPLCFPVGFHSTPALGDITGDGRPDIVASSFNHFIYGWKTDGTLLFKRDLYDTSWSSPVIVDVDGDGRNEIVVASDVEHTNHVLGGPDGGMVWVLDGRGDPLPGYPRRIPGQVIWSSPAVADVNGDGRPDIVVGTGVFFPNPGGWRLHALDARTGQALPGWPVATNGRVKSSPALGDLDGDGRLEVVVISEGGYIYAFNADGSRRWMACDRFVGNACSPGDAGTHSNPAIADVDGDGQAEVISAPELTLRVYNGADGQVEAVHNLGTGASHVVPATTPTIGEIDGRAVIAYQGHVRRGHGRPYGEAGDDHRVQIFTTDQPLCAAPWPSFKGGAARTGRPSAVATRWTPFTCPGPFVDQQYRDLLGREADEAGRTYWANQLRYGDRSGAWLIHAFLRTQEFGRVTAPVTRIHLALTGSHPRSSAALRADGARFRQGVPLATIAQDLVAGTPALAGLSDGAFVEALYRNAVGRAPTATERARDTGRLAAGTTRGALVALLTEGPTATQFLQAPVDVVMMYVGMLDRAPDAGGYAYWVPETRRRGPDRLIRGFQGSSEYRTRVGA